MCERKTAVLTTLCAAMEHSEKLDVVKGGGGGENRGGNLSTREKRLCISLLLIQFI